MVGDAKLYPILEQLNIAFDYYEHPAIPTIEEAKQQWDRLEGMNATHCKNLFFRNHKGNKHYLVILEASQQLNIRDIELQLRQGKISFASEQRMMKYLGLTPGSVSPFGLINDQKHEVIVFIDDNLQCAERLTFHPNLNTASLAVSYSNWISFLNWTGNEYHFLKLYNNAL